VKIHPTADKATFRIPHITHRSAVALRTFHSGPCRILPSAFRMPQFRILPTTMGVHILTVCGVADPGPGKTVIFALLS